MQVLAAFGVAGSVPVALDGGQGTSWRAGDLVLKPSDADLAELAWRAGIHRELVCDGFRLAMPRTAADGSLRVDGWCASEHLAGAHEPGRWSETIEVGDRFHRALDGIPRPRFLDDRTSAWAIGDRSWRPERQRLVPQRAGASDHRSLALLAASKLRIGDRGRRRSSLGRRRQADS